MALRLNRDEYRDKVYGCWLGKSIGGTLGGPFEGRREILDVTGYTTPAGEPLPNDDLDLQLIWLKAVQDRGPRAITNQLLGEYWLNYIPPFWNEYGVCKANMRVGLLPPLSGEYENAKWKHSNGAWIRSEIWACLAPGCPDLALRYAYADASVDHGGGEGTYAEMFTAALESAAFVMSDREELLELALSKIPYDCRVARSIGIARDAYAQGVTWQEARNRVVEDSADLGWFQAPANVAFVVIGWLYGEGDFGKSLLIAVNCGDDTDCTGATLGSILGILYGKKNIPQEWTEPIGERILTIAIDRGSWWGIPKTLNDLTDMVLQQTPQSLTICGKDVALTDGPTKVDDDHRRWMADPQAAQQIWEKSPYAVEFDFVHTRVIVDYQREPKVKAGESFPVKVTLVNQVPSCQHAEISWHLPEGWQILPATRRHVSLRHHPPVETVTVELLPNALPTASVRGTLEVSVQGRPTIGLIPLVFLAE
ncbi:MAG TPA: ADP-ribosylglycohydrolase family protein [Armatimonadota bacterium]|nr:ADP-ribosylglycohydrolase family protein [Armatimonadota bacterium]